MAVQKGDTLDIKIGSTVIASGITDKDVSFIGELLEITDGESNGWRKYAALRGTRGVDVSFSGFATSNVLRDYFQNANAIITNGSLLFGDATTITGDMAISSYKESHKIGKLVEFSCDITFSGQPTFA